jgi:hypothetical protein
VRADLDALVTAIYVLVDDFLPERQGTWCSGEDQRRRADHAGDRPGLPRAAQRPAVSRGSTEFKATKKEPDGALVERAIAATGFDLDLLHPDMGRLAGLRAVGALARARECRLARPGHAARVARLSCMGRDGEVSPRLRGVRELERRP